MYHYDHQQLHQTCKRLPDKAFTVEVLLRTHQQTSTTSTKCLPVENFVDEHQHFLNNFKMAEIINLRGIRRFHQKKPQQFINKTSTVKALSGKRFSDFSFC